MLKTAISCTSSKAFIASMFPSSHCRHTHTHNVLGYADLLPWFRRAQEHCVLCGLLLGWEAIRIGRVTTRCFILMAAAPCIAIMPMLKAPSSHVAEVMICHQSIIIKACIMLLPGAGVACIDKMGESFTTASGSRADKSVIIWTSKAEGILRYSHNDAVRPPMDRESSNMFRYDVATDVSV